MIKNKGIFCAALLLSLTACGGDDKNEQQRLLEQNRSKWESQHIDDYGFDIDIDCFCFGPTYYSVDVVGGNVRRYSNNELRFKTYNDINKPWVDTVDELFNYIDQLLASAESVVVTYHPDLGYPEIISVDQNQEMIDDEFTLNIYRFVVGQIPCEPIVERTYQVQVFNKDNGINASCDVEMVFDDHNGYQEHFLLPETKPNGCMYNAYAASDFITPLAGTLTISGDDYQTLTVDIEAKSMRCGLSNPVGQFLIDTKSQ